MPIDVIRPAITARATHMVRPSSEMVIKEGRGVTVYSAMGVCGTEATGSITSTENANDVTCERCQRRADRELATPEPVVAGSHGWDAPGVLGSPETVAEPRKHDNRSEGAKRHGRIRYERSQRRHLAKQAIRN